MKKSSKIFLALVVTMLLGSTMAFAREGEHEGMKMDSKDMPGDVSDIWKEIKSHEEHLSQVIETNQLGQVHEAAFMIRDLSKALYEKSKSVPPVNGDELKTLVDEIAKIADLLDQYGDAGDKVNTQEQFAKLQETLRAIEKHFPQGILTKQPAS